jgi:CPA2 family monovalent cation:H+ antiporter-2
VLELGVLLAAAAVAGWLARHLGLPAVIGYLVVGLVVSPFTPGYVANREQLQVLADVGVVLLLFEVGIEIDPLRIRHKGPLLWAAPLQLMMTSGIGLAVGALASCPGSVRCRARHRREPGRHRSASAACAIA